jgi:hypothetical protein
MLQIPQTFMAQDEGFRKLASGGDVYWIIHGGVAMAKTTVSEPPELYEAAVRDMFYRALSTGNCSGR